LIETIPLAKRMHHSILNHREMYGLPRKFNIAFDGGGRISSLEDTNDIGFHAVEVLEANALPDLPAGVYFQLMLGGITGHKDFARYTGVLLKPEECVRVAGSIVRVFISSGDRTDRNKARLKYVLDQWGFDKFIAEVEKDFGQELRKVDASRFVIPQREDRFAHVGFHRQKQAGRIYVGLVLPVGRITSDQAEGIAIIAERYGTGEVRLTVWQNLLIPHIRETDVENVKRELERIDIGYEASSFRAGLIACTGNAGCKFAASNTKSHAVQLAEYLETRHQLDQPINIHLTGCHHSCAQHYIGDIGLIACKVERDDDMLEGYHVYVGGGWGERQAIGRLLFKSVVFEELPPIVSTVIAGYLKHRLDDESFSSYVSRKSDGELKETTLICV
jgi:ferredoxin-nitrite reductase